MAKKDRLCHMPTTKQVAKDIAAASGRIQAITHSINRAFSEFGKAVARKYKKAVNDG